MRNLPPTPPETLDRAREIAQAEGLDYVYVGNVLRPEAGNTYCPACGQLLIERAGLQMMQNRLRNGKCPDCAKAIYGVWQ
jgi:pyruvate formate lyase activating enzyme